VKSFVGIQSTLEVNHHDGIFAINIIKFRDKAVNSSVLNKEIRIED
jgi:hypothetical protein